MKRKLKLYKIIYILICVLFIYFLTLLIVLRFNNLVNNENDLFFNNLIIQTSNNEEDYKKESSLSLIMVGDALIHSAVYADFKTNSGYDFTTLLSNVSDYINEYDLAFYNQESILGGKDLGLSTYPRFNSPYEVGDAFREAGFNLVALANNHTLDRGEKAIVNSKNYWNQFDNILTAGSYQSQEEKNEIKIFKKNDITYTLLSYTDTTNGLKAPIGKEYFVNTYSKDKVEEDIKKVRENVDLLMVSMHFGVEYTHTPTKRQREIAEHLASLGVDIVIGHHPHVIQPIEFIDDTMVIYSLGNFVSAQRGVDKLTGLMASVKVTKTTTPLETNIKLENPTAELVYTSSKYASNGGRYDFKLYRYKDLTDKILSNHEKYKEKYLKIATGGNKNIETR